MTAVTPRHRGRAPFDGSGVTRDEQGAARYTGLPSSLVAMLRSTVDRDPGGEALVEVGGERLTYQQLWDRSARVAGGLVEAGLRRGDRVAILLPAGVDWVLGFLGAQLAGAVVVPVNTRFAEPEIDYALADSGASVSLRPGEPLPDGPPFADEDAGPSETARDLLHKWHDRFPKAR